MISFPELPPDFHDEPTAPIDFHTEDVTIVLPDTQILSEWLLSAAAAEQKTVQELNYIFCSDEYLHQINVEYLAHDYYTDIITFPYGTADALHGDLFISTDRVADNAAANHTTFELELRRVMVHGLLHLVGYGDKTPEEIATMRAKEDFYLKNYAANHH
jgi:rRNA maturation RNase YbeY